MQTKTKTATDPKDTVATVPVQVTEVTATDPNHCSCGECIPCLTASLQQATLQGNMQQAMQTMQRLQQAMQTASLAAVAPLQTKLARLQAQQQRATKVIQLRATRINELQQQITMLQGKPARSTATDNTLGFTAPKSGKTKELWELFSANSSLTRKNAISLAVSQGYNVATSSTQYQRWLQSKTKVLG